LNHTTRAALVLPGGGARGAYQVGVLEALAEILPGPTMPFPVVAGISAGAINASVLASHAGDFAGGVRRLAHFWGNLRCEQVYRTGWIAQPQDRAALAGRDDPGRAGCRQSQIPVRQSAAG
jgi:predicted acylesterase/phospholipase RssA